MWRCACPVYRPPVRTFGSLAPAAVAATELAAALSWTRMFPVPLFFLSLLSFLFLLITAALLAIPLFLLFLLAAALLAILLFCTAALRAIPVLLTAAAAVVLGFRLPGLSCMCAAAVMRGRNHAQQWQVSAPQGKNAVWAVLGSLSNVMSKY